MRKKGKGKGVKEGLKEKGRRRKEIENSSE